MGEIRIVGPGKTRGYPYPVCKKKSVCIQSVQKRSMYQVIHFISFDTSDHAILQIRRGNW